MKAARDGALSPQGGRSVSHTHKGSPQGKRQQPPDRTRTGPSRRRPHVPPGNKQTERQRREVGRARGPVSRREQQPERRGPQRGGRASREPARGAGRGRRAAVVHTLRGQNFHYPAFPPFSPRRLSPRKHRQEYIVLARKQTKKKPSRPGVPLRLAGRPRHARRGQAGGAEPPRAAKMATVAGPGAARAACHPGIRTRGGRGPTGQGQGTKPPRFPPPPLGGRDSADREPGQRSAGRCHVGAQGSGPTHSGAPFLPHRAGRARRPRTLGLPLTPRHECFLRLVLAGGSRPGWFSPSPRARRPAAPLPSPPRASGAKARDAEGRGRAGRARGGSGI